jgi:hypothetical protein
MSPSPPKRRIPKQLNKPLSAGPRFLQPVAILRFAILVYVEFGLPIRHANRSASAMIVSDKFFSEISGRTLPSQR